MYFFKAMIKVHTGLFVSCKKYQLLINLIQGTLVEKYHTIAIAGPQQSSDTCEIILCNQQSYGDISGAKHFVEHYLKMTGEYKDNNSNQKTIEVIDLDDDKDVPCITLDDSVIETESVDTEEGENSKLITNSLSQNIPTDSINAEEGPSGLQSIYESNFSTGSKRKYPFHSEGEDDDDDDVIVLDDSFPDLNIDKEPSNNFHGDNLVDLTNVSSPSISSVLIKKPSEINENTLDLKGCLERTANEPVIAKQRPTKLPTTVSTSATSSRDPRPSKTNKASECVPIACTSTTLPATTTTKATENASGEPKVQTHPKKVSKLAYVRPAHLLDPLTNSKTTQSNIYNPNACSEEKRTGLRPIVIDGNNVAIGHGKKEGQFSLKGLEICINYFLKRGHRQIKAFVPHYRVNRETFDGLTKLERQGFVVTTPSRKVNGKVVSSYDDRYIVQYATEVGGVIVSSDNFRDIMKEDPRWKETIENRLLMLTWVDDLLMLPQDPLGRNGPSLDEFLCFPDS